MMSGPAPQVVIVYNTKIMNINITVWPAMTDNYFIFALPDFQLSGRKGNLFDYLEQSPTSKGTRGNIELMFAAVDSHIRISLTR